MDVSALFIEFWIRPERDWVLSGPVERTCDADSDTAWIFVLTRYILLKHTVRLGCWFHVFIVLARELDEKSGAGWEHFETRDTLIAQEDVGRAGNFGDFNLTHHPELLPPPIFGWPGARHRQS